MAPALQPTLPEVDRTAERLAGIIEAFAKGSSERPRVVRGRPSSGREVLLERLAGASRLAGARAVELSTPPPGQDLPAHLLLQVAALAPGSPEARTLVRPAASWSERTDAASALLERGERKVLLLRLPPARAMSTDRPDWRQLQREVSDVLLLLTTPRESVLPIVTAPHGWAWPHRSNPPEEIGLDVRTDARAFLLARDWGPLAPAAQHLWRTCQALADHCSPLQLRLGVALLHFQTPPGIVAAALLPPETLRSLERPLRGLLARRPALAAALRRVACARFPVRREVLLDLAAAGEDSDVLERCFLYPGADNTLRFHDQLRWLVAVDPNECPQTAAHQKLRTYYESLDGTVDPQAGLERVVPWLEKLHHASLSDDKGDVDAWLALQPPSREHYWEYGWALSYVHHRFLAAARVFETVLRDIDPEDNYSRHYVAFNLDRAGQRPLEVEEQYRRAVLGDPSNPWWNSRYITFLTERGKFDAALHAWQEAIEAVDPDGERSGEEWLPQHLHQHVVRAALDSGNLALAEAALEAVRSPVCQTETFLALEERLHAVREVRRLREALFPAELLVSDWWKPRLLRGRAATLSGWRPGRVIAVEPGSVSLALGTQAPDGQTSVSYHEMAREVWDGLCRQAPVEGAFVEVAETDGVPVLEVELPPVSPDAELRARLRHLFRFLVRGS